MSPQSSARSTTESSFLSRLIADPYVQAQRTYLVAKAPIYGPEDAARNLYYVHHGQVRVYQQGGDTRRLVEILGDDQWCGLPALAGAEKYGEGAEAVQPSMVSTIPADRFIAAMAREQQAAMEMIRLLAGKLMKDREQAAALVFDDCRARLIKALVELADSPAATKVSEGVQVQITQLQLAQKVGVTRETCSLTLARLRRAGLVHTGRNKLIYSPDKLREAAGTGSL